MGKRGAEVVLGVQVNVRDLLGPVGLAADAVRGLTGGGELLRLEAVDGGGVMVSAAGEGHDLHATVEAVETGTPGSAYVVAMLLHKVLGTLDEDGSLDLELVHEGKTGKRTLVLREGTTEVQLGTRTEDEAPDYRIPVLGEGHKLEVDATKLRVGLEAVRVCMAKGADRPQLVGVWLIAYANAITLLATDGKRLARAEIGAVSSQQEAIERTTLLPPALVDLLVEALGWEDTCTLAVSEEGGMTLRAGKVLLGRGPLGEKPPEFATLVRTALAGLVGHAAVEAAELQQALRQCMAIGEKGDTLVLGFNENPDQPAVVLRSSCPVHDASSKAQVPIKDGQGQGAVALNATWLLELVRKVRTHKARLEWGGEQHAVLLRPDPDPGVLYVLAPVAQHDLETGEEGKP